MESGWLAWGHRTGTALREHSRTHLSDAFLMDHTLSMQHRVCHCEVLQMRLHLETPGRR